MTLASKKQPSIGEIRKGTDIGFNSHNKYIYISCMDCGIEKWVDNHSIKKTGYRCKLCSYKFRSHEPIFIKCKNCGNEFEVPRWRKSSAKFCSNECYIASKTTARSYHKTRVCETCGKDFLPTQWNQKYCSRKCFSQSVRVRGKKICPTCKKEFTQTRVSSKFCSRECSEPFKIKSPTKIKKDYIDKLWADCVKLLAGVKCEYCGKDTSLNSHHIFSRSNMSLRWDLGNGICLCASHHVLGLFSAHKSPLEFAEWIKEKRGIGWYDRLRQESKVLTKYTTQGKLDIISSFRKIIRSTKEIINE